MAQDPDEDRLTVDPHSLLENLTVKLAIKALLLIACIAGHAPAPAWSQETSTSDIGGGPFSSSLVGIANRLQVYLQGQGGNPSVHVERFVVRNASSGRELTRQLRDLLVERQIRVVDLTDAPEFTVSGWVASTGTKQRFVNLSVRLFDSSGNEVREFRDQYNSDNSASREAANRQLAKEGKEPIAEGAVSGAANEVARLLQVNADVQGAVQQATQLSSVTSPQANAAVTAEQKQAAVAARIAVVARATDPAQGPHFVTRKNGAISATTDSPFEVRLRATADNSNSQPGDGDYLPVEISERAGSPFAEFKENQFYCVDIINRSPQPVGVELTIDGINSLELCEVPEWKQAGRYVVNAGKMITVYGWLRDARTSARFELTSRKGDALAERLGRVQSLGVVAATFYTAKNPGEPEPPIEQLLAASKKTTELATKEGPLMTSAEAVRSLPKVFGVVALAQVAVRYRNPDPPGDLP